MPRQPFPGFIIISGTGRNVGKTFMATALIRAFSPNFPVVALKISPHMHDSTEDTTLMAESPGYRIFRDNAPHRKNSGQFLAAGARESYFIESSDRHLAAAFYRFVKVCNPQNLPVICESGALGKIVQPGLLIFITDSGTGPVSQKSAIMRLANLVLPAKSFDPAEIIGGITFSGNSWQRNYR